MITEQCAVYSELKYICGPGMKINNIIIHNQYFKSVNVSVVDANTEFCRTKICKCL